MHALNRCHPFSEVIACYLGGYIVPASSQAQLVHWCEKQFNVKYQACTFSLLKSALVHKKYDTVE